jgi:hypothetical protein
VNVVLDKAGDFVDRRHSTQITVDIIPGQQQPGLERQLRPVPYSKRVDDNGVSVVRNSSEPRMRQPKSPQQAECGPTTFVVCFGEKKSGICPQE